MLTSNSLTRKKVIWFRLVMLMSYIIKAFCTLCSIHFDINLSTNYLWQELKSAVNIWILEAFVHFLETNSINEIHVHKIYSELNTIHFSCMEFNWTTVVIFNPLSSNDFREIKRTMFYITLIFSLNIIRFLYKVCKGMTNEST